MGLRKVDLGGNTTFMYSSAVTTDAGLEVKLVIAQTGTSYTVKLDAHREDLQRWCQKLQKTPEEYLAQFRTATDTASLLSSAQGEKVAAQDVFEVKDKKLVWKQYFPSENVHGRRGVFALDQLEYETAVSEVLGGAMEDLQDTSAVVDNLKKELQHTQTKLDEAVALTTKSVQAKEELEAHMYGKFVEILNSKKRMIQHLQSAAAPHAPDSAAPTTSSSVHKGVVPKQTKGNLVEVSDSDGYSSDTDVDDPQEEMDTDDEVRSSPGTRGAHSASNKSPPKASVLFDSQELFNSSLEAELCPLGSGPPAGVRPQQARKDKQGKKPPTSQSRDCSKNSFLHDLF